VEIAVNNKNRAVPPLPWRQRHTIDVPARHATADAQLRAEPLAPKPDKKQAKQSSFFRLPDPAWWLSSQIRSDLD